MRMLGRRCLPLSAVTVADKDCMGAGYHSSRCPYLSSYRPYGSIDTPVVAALHQGAPGQMTWLEDPPINRPGSSPGCALPSPAYCFASVIARTENNKMLSYRRETALRRG